MKWLKKTAWILLVFFLSLQFVRQNKNISDKISDEDINKISPVSQDVQAILKNACYDCHSNNTNYPWYSNIQPMGWLMNRHITQGKAALNFSGFGSYSQRRQSSKLSGIANSIKDDIMPLWSYKLMHKNARLTENEKALIINWARQSTDSLSVK